MKRKNLLMLLCLVMFAGCTTFDEIQTGPTVNMENRLERLNGPYRLATPDVLEISVQDNPEIGTRAAIAPDGNVFMPLLGNVYVEGLTLLEVRKKIHKELGRFLKDIPEESVSVQVIGFNSKKVYVYSFGGGSVRAVPFTGDLKVLDALAQSGFLTRTDNLKKIKVVRGTNDPNKNPQRLVLNLTDIVKNGQTEKNIVLRPNDVVYIPPTLFGLIGYKFKDLLFPTEPIQRVGMMYGTAEMNALGFNPQKGVGGVGGSSGGNFQ
ncbi:MAG: polysaccharide export protein [Candidatus Scalindua sp.]|nr:polysaccharide export protein [Candidatus Scalindua sp.]